MMFSEPVSIVIPMYNAEKYITQVLDAIFQQDYVGEREVIVVNDGSRDRSLTIVQEISRQRAGITVIDQTNQGAVSATNNGFKAARYSIICSIDSDVVLHRDWLRKVMVEFSDPQVGAVQGYYKTPTGVPFWSRMMGYDVEKRYDDIKGKQVTQVCTGNTAYRKAALDMVGLFDSVFVYGYDNDMSYRLQRAGYTLVFRNDALCDHYWKADLSSYIQQQYRSAYGRMQLIMKHRDRITGDSVSGLRMILQVPVTLAALLLLMTGAALMATGRGPVVLLPGCALFLVAFIDRIFFAAGVVRKQLDVTVVLMPMVHILRNLVWCWALAEWYTRRLIRRE